MTNEGYDAAIGHAVTEQFPGAVVLRWTLVAEIAEPDSDEALITRHSHGLAPWDNIGMHRYAEAMIAAPIARLPADDD